MDKAEHLQWWDNNQGINNPNLHVWLNDSDKSSREKLFSLISNNNATNILECGPGVYIDYDMFFSEQADINYSAIDITDSIVESGLNRNINVKLNSIESIDFRDKHFDFVYCRHVFEHQSHYEKSLREMLRVSSKFVAVIFWLINDSDEDQISYDPREKLYHNTYSRPKINKLLDSLGHNYEWVSANKDVILFISK